MDELHAKIKEYLKLLIDNYDEIDQNNVGLLDFVIGEVIDYLGVPCEAWAGL